MQLGTVVSREFTQVLLVQLCPTYPEVPARRLLAVLVECRCGRLARLAEQQHSRKSPARKMLAPETGYRTRCPSLVRSGCAVPREVVAAGSVVVERLLVQRAVERLAAVRGCLA